MFHRFYGNAGRGTTAHRTLVGPLKMLEISLNERNAQPIVQVKFPRMEFSIKYSTASLTRT